MKLHKFIFLSFAGILLATTEFASGAQYPRIVTDNICNPNRWCQFEIYFDTDEPKSTSNWTPPSNFESTVLGIPNVENAEFALVLGMTSSTAGDQHNAELGKRRADVVRDTIVQMREQGQLNNELKAYGYTLGEAWVRNFNPNISFENETWRTAFVGFFQSPQEAIKQIEQDPTIINNVDLQPVLNELKNLSAQMTREHDALRSNLNSVKGEIINEIRNSTVSTDDPKTYISTLVNRLQAIEHTLEKSVWKDENGNFNTTRLASDSIAGVVLGTAGGLITSNVIKKNQIAHGFENIKCAIGGQYVAGFNDDFIINVR